MAGSVCSFRTNPQCALLSTSSRKTKVRPPYILQQLKGYLCKLYTDSHPPLSYLILLCSPSTSQFSSDYVSCYSSEGVPACTACAPSSKILLSRSTSVDFLLFFFSPVQPPKSLSPFLILAFHNSSYLFLLQKDCLPTLWPHMASLPFQTCFFFSYSLC